MQKNTKLIVISLAVIVVLIGIAIFFIQKSSDKTGIGLSGDEIELQKEEKFMEELPKISCDFSNDGEAYSSAVADKNLNNCQCVKDDNKRALCKDVVYDISLYESALAKFDETLCDEIKNANKKEACYTVVKNSVDKVKSSDPSYLARVYAANHNIEEAIKQYEKNIENGAGDSIDNFLGLALIYAEKGLSEQEKGSDQSLYVNKAFEVIEKAKEIDANNSEVYRVEAYINEIKPDYKQAISLYDKAIDIDKNNVLAYAGKGHTYRLMGSIDKAIESFGKAAELDVNNNNAFIYSNLCSLEYSVSRSDDAIRNCNIVIGANNVDPVVKSVAYQIMATMVMERGEFSQADNYLRQAKVLTPNDANLFVTLSKLNVYIGNFEEAQLNAEKVLEFSPNKVAGYLALSQSLYMQDKFNEAINFAKKGLDLLESDVSLLAANKSAMGNSLNYMIANCYRNLGDESNQKKFEEAAKNFINN